MILVLLSLAAGTSTRTSALLNNVLGAEITVVNGTTPSFTGGGGGEFGGGGFGGGGFRGGGGFGGFFGSGNLLSVSMVDTIGNMTGVSVVSPQLVATGTIGTESVFIYGINPATYANATGGLNIVGGKTLTSLEGHQIVLSNTLATNLNVSVGDSVLVGTNSTAETTYTVVGIYDPGSTFGAQARSVYVSLSDAQSIAGEEGEVSEIYVRASDANLVSALASEISSAIGGIRAVTASTVTGAASSLTDTLTSFFTIIGLVALMAGAFGVINTMMMSIGERTREIGTLRAIGATKGQVLRLFMSEAFLIGVIGAVAGVVIGIAVSIALPSLGGSSLTGAGGGFGGPGGGGLLRGSLRPDLTLNNLVLSLALGTLVGTLAGIYPAWRASRMDPVEALRHV
jgi:putative ABC transport system permease protein